MIHSCDYIHIATYKYIYLHTQSSETQRNMQGDNEDDDEEDGDDSGGDCESMSVAVFVHQHILDFSHQYKCCVVASTAYSLYIVLFFFICNVYDSEVHWRADVPSHVVFESSAWELVA